VADRLVRARSGQRAEQHAVGPAQQGPGRGVQLGLGPEHRLGPGQPRQPALGQPGQLAPVVVRLDHRGDRLEVAVVAHQEQRVVGPARAEQVGGGAAHGRRGLIHGGRSGQRRAGHPDGAFPAQRPPVRGGHVPEPGNDQQEQHRGEHRDHDVVVVPVPQRLNEQHGRGDQRGQHEHDQAAGRRLGLLL
jgi:hypothetical protein